MIPEDASTKHAVEMCSQKDGKFDFVFQNRKVAEILTESTVTGLKYPQSAQVLFQIFLYIPRAHAPG